MSFLIFIIYKGTTNDGPNKNVEQLKYCSSSLTTVGYGTLWPPDDGSYSENWGHNVFSKGNNEEMSFEDYCMLNSCSDDGLLSIARYNCIEEEWVTTTQEFTEEASMVEKRFLLLKLYAQHRDRRKYHLDPQEGGHCRAGVFQANFCAQLSPEDGSISDCLTYTPDQFCFSRFTPKEGTTKEHIIGAYIKQINDGSKSQGDFAGVSSVNVKYLSNKEVSIPDLLKAFQICSESMGREKRNSASKELFVQIAECTSNFLHKMSDNALTNSPCLENHHYPSANKFPKTITSNELPKNIDWRAD